MADHPSEYTNELGQKMSYAQAQELKNLVEQGGRLLMEQQEARRCGKRMREFVRAGWPVFGMGTLLSWNWHLDAICEHLEALQKREIRKLIINMPPRFSKSSICSVAFNAWVWIDHPEEKFLTSSFGRSLSTRDSRFTRNLIRSEWYQKRWGDRFRLMAGEQTAKDRFENSKGGYRLATSTDSGTVGEGGSIRIYDDPDDPDRAETERDYLQKINEHYDGVLSTRHVNPMTDVEACIQQKCGANDLSAHLKAAGGWEELVLPNEYSGSKYCTSIGWSDPRTHIGELLHPTRFGPVETASAKATTGRRYSALYQQTPAAEAGNIFKREWWEFWHPAGTPDDDPRLDVQLKVGAETVTKRSKAIPAAFEQVVQSWDLAFKDMEHNDFVAGQAWGRIGANTYLLKRDTRHRDFPSTCGAIRAMSLEFPCPEKLIEDKANGPAVIQSLKNEIPGLIPVNDGGGKTARAAAVSGYVEAGNVRLPNPKFFPWVWELLDTLCVVADTKIVCIDGLKRACDIAEGDLVLTHEGRFRHILQVNKRAASNVVRVQTKCLDDLVLTDNHPIYCCAVRGKEATSLEWVPARDIRNRRYRQSSRSDLEAAPRYHDAIGIPVLQTETEIPVLDLAEWATINDPRISVTVDDITVGATCSRYNVVPRFLKLDYEAGRFFGLYAAEGHCTKNGQINFSFHEKEESFHAEVDKFFRERFGTTCSHNHAAHGRGLVVQSSLAILRSLFWDFGKGAGNKRVPPWAYFAPDEFQRGFVAGALDGDGCVKDNYCRICSISESLLWGIRLLLTKQGIAAQKLSMAEERDVVICGVNSHSRRSYSLIWLTDPNYQSGRFTDSMCVYPVRNVTSEPESEVFNFEVEDDHSYVTTGGTVHNCDFPQVLHDDDVDSLTQALRRLYDSIANNGLPEFRVQPRAGEPVTACHIDESASSYPPQWRRWIAIAPGSPGAALWLCETPSKALRITRELLLEGADAYEAGRMVAKAALPDVIAYARTIHAAGRWNVELLMEKAAFAPIDPIGSYAALLEQGLIEYEPEAGSYEDRLFAKDALKQARFSSQMALVEESAFDHLRSLLAFKPPNFERVTYDRDKAIKLSLENMAEYTAYMNAIEGKVTGEWPKLKISPECKALIAALGCVRRTDGVDVADSFIRALLVGSASPPDVMASKQSGWRVWDRLTQQQAKDQFRQRFAGMR